MVDQIKEMQRSDPVAKEQWYAFCAEYGDGVRDPSKHDIAFLQSFVTQYQNGARLENKETQQLVFLIKMGQKKSQDWKRTWEQYCCQNPMDGKPHYDPAKRDASFLEGFFDFIGKMAQGAAPSGGGMSMGMGGMSGMGSMGGMGGMGMGMGPPVKKGPGMGALSGDPMKDQLVMKVKGFQRLSEENKQAWHHFCDTNLGGMYDPNRHDAGTLQMFVSQYGAQDIPAGGMGSSGPGMGANHPLVMKVKAYQKMGEPQKQAWHSYCDTNLGGKYDPARHSEEALNNFVASYGVP